jgi:hypothetical protein
MRSLLAAGLLSLLVLGACGDGLPHDDGSASGWTDPARSPTPSLLERLSSIEGMTVERELSAPAGHRFFSLRYVQPVHHWDATQGTFEQRLTLLHRAEDAPVVLASTGYSIGLRVSRAEPTRLLEANQVTVEHRFFAPSRPGAASWKRLNVQQAAADHHRVVRALQPVYGAPWVSTGASKGGMTSIYHRRFYPGDVVATVAYVAPHHVEREEGPSGAHATFLATVGEDPSCNAALARVQRDVLLRRAELVPLLERYARDRGLDFVGGAARSLEVMAVDAPFIFWQYGGAAGCRSIPAADATASALFRFLDATVGIASYSHQDADRYIPYYYQAGTQLGYPQTDVLHLADLLTFADVQEPRFYVPAEIPVEYRPIAMRDIDDWVKQRGERLMLIYGEHDPWSAEPFEFGPGTRDSHRYTVPRGNHGATIGQLPAGLRDEAIARLRGWVGRSLTPEPRAIAENELDAVYDLMVVRPRL